MALAVQSIRWISFGISGANTRTIVHFFPSEGGVSAPYPATCTLRIFGSTLQEKKVVIEGARLSHPDGVRLEQAFPFLTSETVGIYGLEIEVATIQPRVDVSPSSCVVEFVSKGQSVRYWPVRLAPVPTLLRPDPETSAEGGEVVHREVVHPLIRDAYGVPSLIGVNGIQEDYEPKVRVLGGGTLLSRIAAGGAVESLCDEGLFGSVTPKEASWGLVRARTLGSMERASSAPRALFLMYREPVSRRPMSVVSLMENGSL